MRPRGRGPKPARERTESGEVAAQRANSFQDPGAELVQSALGKLRSPAARTGLRRLRPAWGTAGPTEKWEQKLGGDR